MNAPEYLVVITGLSGSGKSYVQSTLEDLGFYCTDNLPIELIEPYLDEVTSHEKASRVGIVVDVRTHDFATLFPPFYRERLKRRAPNAMLIFLDASDEVLARRYSETRRPHPMAKDRPVVDAIREERAALTEVKSLSDMVLDTSAFSVHELKAEVMRRFGMPGERTSMLVTVISFGFKHSMPYNLDLLFDVRFLPNPHFIAELRPKTGLDPEVVEYLRMIRTATSGLRRSISSKREPLMATSLTSVTARASAVRGKASRTAISPKKSPFSRRERRWDSEPMCLMISTAPS